MQRLELWYYNDGHYFSEGKLGLLIINPKYTLIKEINSPLVSIEGGKEADARWDWCHACVLCVYECNTVAL